MTAQRCGGGEGAEDQPVLPGPELYMPDGTEL
jgi:hypothetical protein